MVTKPEPDLLPAAWAGPRYERLGEFDDEPRFPDPYMDLYRRLVEEMEADMAVIPGMGTLARILIRMLARDRVAALMSDRQDSIAVEVRCGQGHSVFVPLWPENNARLLRSANELLKQARAADLDHALRTEYVIGLVAEVMAVLEREVTDSDQRLSLKESMRSAFRSYVDSQNTKRRKVGR
jgi:hypothetical protein